MIFLNVFELFENFLTIFKNLQTKIWDYNREIVCWFNLKDFHCVEESGYINTAKTPNVSFIVGNKQIFVNFVKKIEFIWILKNGRIHMKRKKIGYIIIYRAIFLS